MNRVEKLRLIRSLKLAIKDAGLTQQDIANKIGVDQSRVSRLLGGHFQRWSGDIKKLCGLFDLSPDCGFIVDATKNKVLTEALNRNWDGTMEQADLIARYLDDLGEIIENSANKF
jgi:transcriptional regulator with XRE-family HTH domain